MMFRDFAESRIVLFDGAMGTSIQKAELPDEVWQGKNGCNELLNIASPETIFEIHKRYFEAGADVAVTNTFGAVRSVLAEYGLENSVYEINKKAVEIAREASLGMENKFVALSIGPGTKLASLGHTSYGALYAQYIEQAEAGINADIFIIETAQDLIQMKAAVNACRDAAEKFSKDIPIIVSFTLEHNNTLLTGSDISAAAAVLGALNIYALGINCAMGPDMMKVPLSKLTECWGGRLYISPNAGLPETINGKTIYPMDAKNFGSIMDDILSEFPIMLTGGCCGTDETHIKALRHAIDKNPPRVKTAYKYSGLASSLYAAVSLKQSPAPAMVGERANATGSKAFRELLLAEDIDGITALCKDQEEGGAHFIDLSLAYAGRNEKDDYNRIIPVLNKTLTAPLVIDSTDPDIVIAAAENYSGKPIINSVNLEDGGIKMRKMLNAVKKHPACVVALTIDENGMAQTCAEKIKIAERIYKIWTGEYNFSPEDLIIDTLTFSIGSGDETLNFAARETLCAIKEIKERLNGVKTVLGISNVSFGLSPASRQTLNSVFLSEAVKVGLDMAIVHASKLFTFSDIPQNDTAVCLDLINGKSGALAAFIEHFASRKVQKEEENKSLPATEALSLKIIKGDKSHLQDLINKAAEDVAAEDIINKILFPAMQKVGELFGEGKILLPFVLQSAEAMKAAVTFLEPRLKKSDVATKGTVVLATVQGDVHDIGKNLVDIIMSNNGFTVHNLGIKVPVSDMIQKAIETGASAIGMSGLLVKSTHIMRENIVEISKKLPDIKIMLGGAALTEKFVNESCAPIMPDKVFYCRDAFDNIAVMNGNRKAAKDMQINQPSEKPAANTGKQSVIKATDIPYAPFFGVKELENINPEEVFDYLNKASLFSGGWGYKKKEMRDAEYEDMLKKNVLPEYEAMKSRILGENILVPKARYGYFKAVKRDSTVELFWERAEYPALVLRFPVRKTPPFISVVDFFSESADKPDVMPMQIVTLGQKPVEYCKKLFAANNYKDYYMAHGFFTEFTDALAEFVHKKIRQELQIDGSDAESIDGILSGKYRGRRYSFGYPMLPDIENNAALAGLLSAERIGVKVNNLYQMVPEYTTSAIIIHHPVATY